MIKKVVFDTNIYFNADGGTVYKQSDSFEKICEDRCIYVLDNAYDLGRFLHGSGDFPIIKKGRLEKVEFIYSEDEVSIDKVSVKKIYAIKGIAGHIYKAHRISALKYAFINIDASAEYAYPTQPSLQEAIKNALDYGYIVFQFDTQEEFLRWALEKITGKRFRSTPPGGFIPYYRGKETEVFI